MRGPTLLTDVLLVLVSRRWEAPAVVEKCPSIEIFTNYYKDIDCELLEFAKVAYRHHLF